jgi:hypothetical protein
MMLEVLLLLWLLLFFLFFFFFWSLSFPCQCHELADGRHWVFLCRPYGLTANCFSFVSTTELTTRWVFINTHFATKPATVTMNNNKQETACRCINADVIVSVFFCKDQSIRCAKQSPYKFYSHRTARDDNHYSRDAARQNATQRQAWSSCVMPIVSQADFVLLRTMAVTVCEEINHGVASLV